MPEALGPPFSGGLRESQIRPVRIKQTPAESIAAPRVMALAANELDADVQYRPDDTCRRLAA